MKGPPQDSLVWDSVSPQMGHREPEKYSVIGFPGWCSCKLTGRLDPAYLFIAWCIVDIQ